MKQKKEFSILKWIVFPIGAFICEIILTMALIINAAYSLSVQREVSIARQDEKARKEELEIIKGLRDRRAQSVQRQSLFPILSCQDRLWLRNRLPSRTIRSASFCRAVSRGCFLLFRCLHPIARQIQFQNHAVMNQTINGRGRYTGVVSNELLLNPDLKEGDVLQFDPEHIYDIITQEMLDSGGPSVMEEMRRGWAQDV
jgi:hypothetical protein